MRWHRKDEFRLKNLCRFPGSSEERFTRLFRAATNASPAQFYNRMLLERGRTQLPTGFQDQQPLRGGRGSREPVPADLTDLE